MAVDFLIHLLELLLLLYCCRYTAPFLTIPSITARERFPFPIIPLGPKSKRGLVHIYPLRLAVVGPHWEPIGLPSLAEMVPCNILYYSSCICGSGFVLLTEPLPFSYVPSLAVIYCSCYHIHNLTIEDSFASHHPLVALIYLSMIEPPDYMLPCVNVCLHDSKCLLYRNPTNMCGIMFLCWLWYLCVFLSPPEFIPNLDFLKHFFL